MPSQHTIQAMDRSVRFWDRQMSEEILAAFNAEGDVTLSAALTMEGEVRDEYPPLYNDVPKMLRDFENRIRSEELAGDDGIWDDDLRIPQAWPELQFGNGMPGAIFGAPVVTTSTEDHTCTPSATQSWPTGTRYSFCASTSKTNGCSRSTRHCAISWTMAGRASSSGRSLSSRAWISSFACAGRPRLSTT